MMKNNASLNEDFKIIEEIVGNHEVYLSQNQHLK